MSWGHGSTRQSTGTFWNTSISNSLKHTAALVLEAHGGQSHGGGRGLGPGGCGSVQNVNGLACASTRACLSCLENSEVNHSDCRKRVCLPTTIHFPFSCLPWHSLLLSSWHGAGGRLPARTDVAGPLCGPVWHAWLHCPTAGGPTSSFWLGHPLLNVIFMIPNHRAASPAPDLGSAMVSSQCPCRIQIYEIRSSGAALSLRKCTRTRRERPVRSWMDSIRKHLWYTTERHRSGLVPSVALGPQKSHC